MDRPALKTLILPFERQDRAFPDQSNQWAFFNAHALPKADLWRSGIVCQQSFRPAFLDLQNSRLTVEPVLTQQGFPGAMVLTDRAKAVNERNIAQAALSVVDGAPVLVAGEKNTGIAPLKKWAGQQGSIVDAFSKFHAQCFTIIASPTTKKNLTHLCSAENAGLFAKGKIDKGSALLMSTFDQTLGGDVADFCAGTGHLAKAVMDHVKPTSLTLLEADYHAVEASRKIMADAPVPISYHWLDLTREAAPGRYDTILMNPPFHVGRAAEPLLGQNLIKAAARSLRAGGCLRLVANRTLPYEKTLEATFGSFKEIIVADGFKVLQARSKS